jgi:hypothetical protein
MKKINRDIKELEENQRHLASDMNMSQRTKDINLRMIEETLDELRRIKKWSKYFKKD